VLVADDATTGYDIALVSTDLTATATQVIERYASRWCIVMWAIGVSTRSVSHRGCASGGSRCLIPGQYRRSSVRTRPGFLVCGPDARALSAGLAVA